jgi:hypothetical protein
MFCIIIVESVIKGEVIVVLIISGESVKVLELNGWLNGLSMTLSACSLAIELDLPIWRWSSI